MFFDYVVDVVARALVNLNKQQKQHLAASLQGNKLTSNRCRRKWAVLGYCVLYSPLSQRQKWPFSKLFVEVSFIQQGERAP